MPPPISPIEEDSYQGQYQQRYQRALSTPKSTDATDGTPQPESTVQSAQNRVQSTVIDRLSLLPEVRQIPWRLGLEPPPERAANASRFQHRGAVLLSTRGKAVPAPCTHCAAGNGRFSQCIALDLYFRGACSTCVYASKSHNCSLRLQISGPVSKGEPDSHASNPDMYSASQQSKAFEPSTSIKKRKRRSEPATASSYSKQHHGHHASTSFDLNSILQEAIANEDFSGTGNDSSLLGKRRKRPSKKAMDSARDSMVDAKQTPTNTSAPPQHARQPRNRSTIDANPVAAQHANYTRQNMSADEILSYLKSPARASPHRVPDQQSTPPIETFTKAKQRQIYAVISGLQGNINHLQSQLTSLKSVLGIDLDDF